MHAPTLSMSSCSVHNVAVRFLAHSACGPAAPLSPRPVCGPAVLFPPRSMHGPGAHVRLRSLYGNAVTVSPRPVYGTAVHRPLRFVQVPAVSMFTWSVHNATALVLALSDPPCPCLRVLCPAQPRNSPRSMHDPAVTLPPRSAVSYTHLTLPTTPYV